MALTLLFNAKAEANLVQNNSFEDDGFPGSTLICPISGWVGCAGINAGEAQNVDPILASHTYLAIGTVGRLGLVSQDIHTISGQSYRFTFAFSSDGDASNRFQALWDGHVLMDVSGTPFDPNWATGGCPYINDHQYEICVQSGGGGPSYHSFDVTASLALTTISFGGQGNASGTSFVGIDDVFVTALPITAVPEPGTLPLFGAGGMAVLGFMRRRRCRVTVRT